MGVGTLELGGMELRHPLEADDVEGDDAGNGISSDKGFQAISDHQVVF